MEKPSQYHLWYKGMVIESTGYLPSLGAAREYVTNRYSSTNGLLLQKCYPVLENEKHPVNKE